MFGLALQFSSNNKKNKRLIVKFSIFKKNEMEDICVTRFREYIRVNTMQPEPDYAGAYLVFWNFLNFSLLRRRNVFEGVLCRNWSGV